MNQLGLIAVTAATVALAGPSLRRRECPEFSAMADFDLEGYTGAWYEIVRDRATPFEFLAGCVVADYGLSEDGESVSVRNSAHKYHQGWSFVEGEATPAGIPGTGSLAVHFDGMPQVDEEANYTVLDTDYETYSIVYSCGTFYNLLTFDMLWVLAREPYLDAETMDRIEEVIATKLPSYNFERNAHYTRQGGDCAYEDRFDADYYLQ